ncbi:hypothetical protein CARUB_v10002328mg [Capsella rubella]|uniref:Uncharacterized protein n=1 Tax=Capsella rubella TaxID=81985 RepID=R0HDN3_9BRAS|nr:uncharacterized protein LOC17883471 [Capsella rubella]XP_023637680.1 uncharacterized protein LOC17883471 [Capsella rubella]EOA21858.1 hypothetical protein CARUB_v10002328mg [Capsella rubella]EOA21859.1 hypothetical protein CARUB_v10002328mg [Capsella rubella]
MAESPSHSDAQLVAHQAPAQQAESDLTSLVFELSQQVQMGMESMLKMVNEIDQNSVGIKEEIEKSKDFAMERKRVLEEEKEQFQKAAYTILDMLSHSRG